MEGRGSRVMHGDVIPECQPEEKGLQTNRGGTVTRLNSSRTLLSEIIAAVPHWMLTDATNKIYSYSHESSCPFFATKFTGLDHPRSLHLDH